MQGAAPDVIEPLVASLQQAHALIQGTGVKDFESHALFLGLRALGQESLGITMLRDYVSKYRRSGWPISEPVRKVLRSNGSSSDCAASTVGQLERQSAVPVGGG
jgi:hypothetical protein